MGKSCYLSLMASALHTEIRNCKLCEEHLPFAPNPIVQFAKNSRILIVGQAPGVQAHKSSLPWNDKSGERLRDWLGVTSEEFYNPELFAIVPMGLCYPGKGKSGDLPPRKECAPKWMNTIRRYLSKIELEIYIGKYACDYEFGKNFKLSDLIQTQVQTLDNRMALPHPSPRNNIWLAKNPWFESEILPQIRKRCQMTYGTPSVP